jgi:hypothetical protein
MKQAAAIFKTAGNGGGSQPTTKPGEIIFAAG